MYKIGRWLNKLNLFFLQDDLCADTDQIPCVAPLIGNVQEQRPKGSGRDAEDTVSLGREEEMVVFEKSLCK